MLFSKLMLLNRVKVTSLRVRDSTLIKNVVNNLYYSQKHLFSLHARRDLRRTPLSTPQLYVPQTIEEEEKGLNMKTPVRPMNTKQLKISIIGLANSGKSTLINQLVGVKICSASSKPQTTIHNARAILTEDNTRLIFLDTPGLVSNDEIKRFKLDRSLSAAPEHSLQDSDVIAVLHDISGHFYQADALPPLVMRLLHLYPHIPSILILNKTDLLRQKKTLLTLTKKLTCSAAGGKNAKVLKKKKPETEPELFQKISNEKVVSTHLSNDYCDKNVQSDTSKNKSFQSQNPTSNSFYDEPYDDTSPKLSEDEIMKGITDDDVYEGRIKLTEAQVQYFIKDKTGWPKFQDVFMISALIGKGVDDLREYFLMNAIPSQWDFGSDVITDQSQEDVALMIVREKYLERLKNNIPYEFKFKIEHCYLSENDLLHFKIKVIIPKHLFKHAVGLKGTTVTKICLEAEDHLRTVFTKDIKLKINLVKI